MAQNIFIRQPYQ